jgi:arginine N-succinyltransferase
VGLATMPAKHLLESIGLRYLNEVDPFDGGPHYGANLEEITLVKKFKNYEVVDGKVGLFDALAIVGLDHADGFRAVLSYFDVKDKKLILPDSTRALLDITSGDKVNLTPISEGAL